VASVSGFIAFSVEKETPLTVGTLPRRDITYRISGDAPAASLGQHDACPFTIVELRLWLREFGMKLGVISHRLPDGSDSKIN
jgi:hypothetical protein